MKEGLEGYMEKIADLKDVAAMTKSENDINSTDGKSAVEIGGKNEKEDTLAMHEKADVAKDPDIDTESVYSSMSDIPEEIQQAYFIVNPGHMSGLKLIKHADKVDMSATHQVEFHMRVGQGEKIPEGKLIRIDTRNDKYYTMEPPTAGDISTAGAFSMRELTRAMSADPEAAGAIINIAKQEIGNRATIVEVRPENFTKVVGPETADFRASAAERNRESHLLAAKHARVLLETAETCYRHYGIYERDIEIKARQEQELLEKFRKDFKGSDGKPLPDETLKMYINMTGVTRLVSTESPIDALETLRAHIQHIENYYHKKT